MESKNAEKIIAKFIKDLDISSDDYITVAELSTTLADGLTKTIDTNTALISDTLIRKIKSSQINPVVNNSSAYYDKDYRYKPSFWLYLSKSSGLKKAEPLVVSWCSGNHTTLMIDQGFLSAFKLSPRLLKDEILWDDLKKPEYDVVRNKLLSQYKYPTHSKTYVRIKKEYLEAYLAFRKKTAIQIFTIKRDIPIDEEIYILLKDKKHFLEDFKQFEVKISRLDHKENMARLEINGFKVLLENSDHNNEEKTVVGHYWKGIDGLVTEWRARHEIPFEYVYVSDKVLAVYEADEDAEYDEEYTIDLSTLRPTVAFPHLPENTRTIDEVGDVKIDQVVIGSCTNGRIEDMRTAAKILEGREVAKGVRCIVFPATQAIYLQCIEEGIMTTFIKAGCAVSTPTCGPCLGGHMGILAKGERAVATTNRNFVGRMGDPESEVYLASPAVAAASAITGKISGPEELGL